jgi:polar amino acid transport system substrate-binding protein
MAQGKYDAAISSISITEERQRDMLFSDPYFMVARVITVHKDNTSITGKDSLTGKVVGVESGSTSAADLSEMEGVIIKTYTEYDSAFNDLMNGVIDAVVSDDPIAVHYVVKNPDKLRLVGEAFTTEHYGIAVAKSKTKLLAKINAGLKSVKRQGLIEELSRKWLP